MTGPVIEKGVPVPDAVIRTGRETRTSTKYPFRELEVGDSILYPKGWDRSLISRAMSYFHRTTDIKLGSSRMSDGSVRVWRLS